MDESPNARTVRVYWEACWNERQLDRLSDVFHPEYTHGRTSSSPASHAEIIRETLSSFPDMRVHVDELEDLSDTVITRSRFVGTQDGAFCGLPATSRHVDAPSLDVFFFRRGRVARLWHLFDHLPLFMGIGAEVCLGEQVAILD